MNYIVQNLTDIILLNKNSIFLEKLKDCKKKIINYYVLVINQGRINNIKINNRYSIELRSTKKLEYTNLLRSIE